SQSGARITSASASWRCGHRRVAYDDPHVRPDPPALSRTPFMRWFSTLLLSATLLAALSPGDRPKMPEISKTVMFNTPEADRILAALQVFPPDNPWNEDISKLPVHPISKKMIAGIGADKRLAYNLDMCFILVPPDQKKLQLKLISYPDE